MDLNLKGRTALVTGASKGIGFHTALRFAQEGCHVHLSREPVPILRMRRSSFSLITSKQREKRVGKINL